MFTEYVEKAMKQAHYEMLEDGTFWGDIPGFFGVWGNGPTLEDCRTDLRDALEGWLVLKLWDNDDDIPVLGRLNLTPRKIKSREKREAVTPSRSRKAS